MERRSKLTAMFVDGNFAGLKKSLTSTVFKTWPMMAGLLVPPVASSLMEADSSAVEQE
jgi:hypothetical protein